MTRRSWIQINGELIPKDEYYSSGVANQSPVFVADIKPYKSAVTGEIVGGRAQHREHMRRHNLVEIGNEKIRPRAASELPGLREDLMKTINRR